ncbi:unnamed protein product, partial [Ectocarpus sp. 12 AP-2014]
RGYSTDPAKAGVREGVNVCFGDRRESALHVAAVQGADNVSGTLLIAGADANLLDGAGQSPLHVAASEGHHRVIRLLLLKEANANGNMSGWMHDTPLDVAAMR